MWYELKIEACPNPEIDFLSEFLTELGALSVTLSDKNDDPILEPELGTTPLWPEVIITALYAEAILAEEARITLNQTYPYLQIKLTTVHDEDWQETWKKDLKPLKFGEHLWVCPSWLTPPDSQATNIILDPGLAFGSGSHPTTALCLEYLSQLDLKDKTILDFGCGSGILALGALKLGARLAYAVDIDPQALEATRNNARLNGIADSRLIVLRPEELEAQVDLILANILLKPLLELKERFHLLLKPQGILIVSGILVGQKSVLEETYTPLFNLKTQKESEDWACLSFEAL